MPDKKTIVDIPEALNRAMGDVDFLKTMLDELQGMIPEFATRLQKALRQDDMDSLDKDAHQLKGSAANLGAKAIAAAAWELEKIGKSGTSAGAEQAFQRLEGAIEDFKQHMAQLDWSAVQPG